MSVFVKCELVLKPAELEKAREMLQRECSEPVVLLPAGFDLAQPKIMYECDRRACESCSEDCHLTSSIEHAKNFRVGLGGIYVEVGDEVGTV